MKANRPDKTVMRVGEVLDLPSEFVWGQLAERLLGPRGFPRIACELYFAVYLTNLPPGS